MFARLGKWDLHFYIRWGPLNFNATMGRLIALISKSNINCRLWVAVQYQTFQTVDLLLMVAITLGGIASICFKSLWTQIQRCQGCQIIRNFLKNSKILFARSTIQPKLSQNIKKYIKIHSKIEKTNNFKFKNYHLMVKHSLLVD